MSEIIIAFVSVSIAVFSLLISYDNRRYVRFTGRVNEIKNAIMEVYESGCQSLMREDNDAKAYFFQSCSAYRNLNALCRDNIELDSILGATTVKPALNKFYKLCVCEDLTKVEFDSDEGHDLMEQLETSRRELVVSVEEVAKKLNRFFYI